MVVKVDGKKKLQCFYYKVYNVETWPLAYEGVRYEASKERSRCMRGKVMIRCEGIICQRL